MRSLPRRAQERLSALYSGRIKTAAQAVGVHPMLVLLWRLLRRLLLRLEYLRASNPYRVQFGGRTVAIEFSDHKEFERIATLGNETKVLRRLIKRVSDDDVVWDIGANIGTHTCLFASHTTHGRVVAFEPFPAYVEAIRRNGEINGFDNITIKELALGNESGTTELQTAPDERHHEGRHTVLERSSSAETIEIEVRRGDEVAGAESPIPNIVKIDVEGAELQVLRGMSETLSNPDCRVVLCEIHPQHDVDQETVEALLADHGFSRQTSIERGSEVFVLAEK